jgi:hypothetical protein
VTVRRTTAAFTVLRDTASFLGGWAIIFKQAGIFFVPPPHPNEVLIGIAALIIGVPGVAHVLTARFGGQPTGPPPSPPPEPVSSPSSPGA